MLTCRASALPGYQIIEQLYTGSRTLVYRAVHEANQQPVVIKLLKNEHPSFNELVQFRNQYTIAKNLNSSGVIQPYSLKPYGNGYAMIMEDFGGVSLSKYVREKAAGGKLLSLPITEFLAIALQLCDILHDLYQQRVIHKDIKPANILINPETQQVKLIDFSIASLLPRETSEIQSFNILEGTLAYLSPEQTGRMNRGVDYRSDFYSLGVTFYELLTGQLPFVVDEPLELIHCHIAKHPPSINSLNPEIPLALSAIVGKLTAKNAENRYQNAFGLKHDLNICFEQWQQVGRIELVIGQRDVCERFLISERLHGRESEVQMLLDAFERVSQGSTEAMLVAGFSGIGKTAVVNEVHKPIVRQRGYFIKGKFDQFQRNIPLSAFVQAFRDLMGQLLSASDAELDQWKTNILAAVGEYGQVIIDVIPELERIIGTQPPVPELFGSAAQNRFDRLLQQFIQVFTAPAHPLVIFIDDLQWADSASLNLMRTLIIEANTRYLLLIGAYRDNEVTLAHPLMLSLDEMHKSGATVNTMALVPLTQASVNQLVADTLSCSLTLASPLTTLLMDKTGGNPFFTTQFLKALYDDQLITFNRDENYWECDVAQVRSLSLTDDVVAFMAAQLQKLPTQTQTVLKLAACIGSQFDLSTLAIVSEQTEAETAAVLWKALQESLVIPQSEVYKFYQADAASATTHPTLLVTHPCSYRFLHDRVQQAAYSLIPEEQKQDTQLQIGRLLLQNTPIADVEANVFEIVGHWNQALEAITTSDETVELARLNLLAGRKAKASAAYPAALNYLQVGLRLLDPTAWCTQYELTLQLHEVAADAAYLSGEFEVAEQLIKTIFTQARSYADQIKGYEVRLQSYMAQARLADALHTGLSILKLLGIALPEAPTSEEIQRELRAVATALTGKSLTDLAELLPMQDPMCLAAMRILVNIIAATYQFAPALFPLIVCKMMQITLEHGNSPDAAFAYACYGMMLLQQDLESAHQYGQLACQLDSTPHTGDRVRATFVAGSILFHCKLHVREALPFLLRSYQAGLETGNFQFGGYALMNRAQYLYLVGQELTRVRQEMDVASHALTTTKQGNTLPWAQSFEQAVLNLLDQSDNPCQLIGTAYDETRSLPQQLAANDRTGLHYVYLNKLILSYLFGQYQSAAENAAQAESYLDGVLGFLDGYVFRFYDSLTQLALYGIANQHEMANEASQGMVLAKVQENQTQMQVWASYAPMNFQHKHDLVEAERCRVLGQKAEAMDLYDRAIALALKHEYLNEAAIANELAAKFYLEWGKERIAQEYLVEAYYGYAHWGAKAKVIDLETRYPQLLAPILQQSRFLIPANETIFGSSTVTSTSSSSIRISDSLDLAAILKASQTLSSEIELNKLLSTLLQLVIENAGADKCVLMLMQNDSLRNTRGEGLFINGFTAIEAESVVLQQTPVQESQDIPLKLIYSVKNRLEAVVLSDATAHPEFVADPYFLRQHPRSVLCSPILHQGKLLGIVYLENNLTIGAFTSDRVQILNLLCAQAAISLENACLYQQAQQALQDLQHAQIQIVQSEKMSALGNLVAGVAHEINNPIGFIAGNLQPALNYVKDIFGLLDLYQQEYPNPSAAIQDEIDTIDLNYVRQDLPKLISSMRLGVDRIRNISTSLRTFSRADKDYKVLFNIHEGIDSTILILTHRLKANSTRPAIKIDTDYGSIPIIECFPGQLNQVFMNILANAIDALEEASQKRTAEEISARPNQIEIQTRLNDSEQVVVHIRDNGMGMPDEVKQRVFDHLFTTKAVGKGTGLGLAIAHQIVVEKHNGEIEVSSTAGIGTEFMITLPVKAYAAVSKLHNPLSNQ